MELVSNILFPFTTHKSSKGCILVFEYAHFLSLQEDRDKRSDIDAAVKQYQESQTQVSVSTALQQAIREHENGHDALEKAIFYIVVLNQMCKLIISCIVASVSNWYVHKPRDF